MFRAKNPLFFFIAFWILSVSRTHAVIIGSLGEWHDNKINILAINDSELGPVIYIHQSGSAIGWRTRFTNWPWYVDRHCAYHEGRHEILAAFANHPEQWPQQENEFDIYQIENTIPQGFRLRHFHENPLYTSLLKPEEVGAPDSWLSEGQVARIHISIAANHDDPINQPNIEIKDGMILDPGTYPRPIQFNLDFVQQLNELGKKIFELENEADALKTIRQFSHILLRNLGGFTYLIVNRTTPGKLVLEFADDPSSPENFGNWFVNKAMNCERMLKDFR